MIVMRASLLLAITCTGCPAPHAVNATTPRTEAAAYAAVLKPLALQLYIANAIVTIAATRSLGCREDEQVGRACSVAAPGLAIELALPSGANVTVETDRRGRATFALPDSEPKSGVVTATANGLLAIAMY